MNFLNLDLPTLVTLSATDLKAEPEYSLATRLDWRKVPRYLEGSWPKPWPTPHFIGDDVKADNWWLRIALKSKYCVFDVETEKLPDGTYSGKIIQVGLYPCGGTPAIWDRVLHPKFSFVQFFEQLITRLPMVAHNTPFDVGRIRDNFGISVWKYVDLHDTILMHHILWPEFPHGLEFLQSLHSEHPKAKHLGVGNYDYLVGDVVGTAESYEAMLVEFANDPASAKLYYEELKPLMPIIIEYMQHGVPVNSDFVAECLSWIPQQMACAKRIAEAYCGYPVSLESGPQLRVLLDDIEDIFSMAKKLTGISVKKELTPAGELSLDKDTVSALRSAFLPIDFNEELDSALALSRIANGAHPLLEAKALWGRARILMSNYIKPTLIPLTEGEDGRLYYEGSLFVGEGSPQKRFDEAHGGRYSY